MKHTPGPWQLFEVGELGHLCPAAKNGVSILTVVTEGDVDFAAVYEDADARLIAAAPELLEALQEMYHAFNWGDMNQGETLAISKARAAIAKATNV